MAEYIYAVKQMFYGTPTGSNTLPASLSLLPDTVKGTITVEETEGTLTKFWVDQKKEPVRVIKSEEGDFTLTAQFYDFDFEKYAAFKGGVGVAGASFTPSTDYTTIDKAFRIVFDSGHVMDIYNGSCVARMTGGGGRDKMFAWELKVTPMLTQDLAGSYMIAASGV